MRPRIQKPPSAKNIAEALSIIEKWDTDVRQFIEAGGDRPSFEEEKAAVLAILPNDIKREVLMRLPAATEMSIYWFVVSRAGRSLQKVQDKSGKNAGAKQ